MIPSAVPGDHHTTTGAEPTSCPVELCEETVDYTDLIPHLYSDHDGQELCEAIANLVADLAQEERACAERGRYLAEVDAALIAAGQDEAGGYIAYPRRIQQLAGEARFWHFEYREAMDNYKDEAAALRDARAELAAARAAIEAVRHVRVRTCEHGDMVVLSRDILAALNTAPAACTCGAAPVHQHGCQAGQ